MRVFPIKTLLPQRSNAQRIASLGSGKLSAEVLQSKALALDDSYLRVVKPQYIDASLISETQEFYNRSRFYFNELVKNGKLESNEKALFYYQQHHHSGSKLGGWIIGVDAEEYVVGNIKKHENTLTAKENRLVRHIAALESMAEPVLLSQKLSSTLNGISEELINGDPSLQVSDEHYNIHRVWVLKDPSIIDIVVSEFNKFASLYIADGHHRCAASSRYLIERYGPNSGKGIMALVMNEDELLIKPFFRMLSHVEPEILWEFLDASNIHHFEVAHSLTYEDLKKGQILCLSKDKKCIIELDQNMFDSSALSKLDVRVLETKVLREVFNLKDSSNEDRLSFMRGDTPIDTINAKLHSGEINLAFLFAPNTMTEIRQVADEGDTMPAKSTFIEPKIPTGLIIEDYR